MRTIKPVGGRIIEFLDQIENFQKMLWEKRKFITETQYCITVGNIDEAFSPDIAACEPQWAEWRDLFHIDEEETDLFTTGKDKKGRHAAVIWRETEGWKKSDLERDKRFVARQKLNDGADEVFVNGDSFIPNARALESVFKARTFAPVEA